MSRTGHDYVAFTNKGAGNYDFSLLGGEYGVVVTATWGGGSVTLSILAPDGVTYIVVAAAFTADTFATYDLPAGSYRLAVATSTAAYMAVSGISL